ncbi:hypothetical protein ECFDA507_2465, partial [Escherichia coli FDA507]|jgi:hypothetical protein
MREY